MGKKHKKDIRKAFKGWDDITPEEQMQNADEFFDIEEEVEDDENGSLLDLGYSKKRIIDKEFGLEKEIITDIVKTFGPKDNSEDDTEYEEIEEEEVPESVQNVLDSLEDIITNTNANEASEDTEVEEEVDKTPVVSDKTTEDAETDPFDDIRKFGCIVRKELRIANFNDGLAPFTFNYYCAMEANLANKNDTSILTKQALDIFRKALIVNRFPAALYTTEEFVASGVLNKGEFVQNDVLNAIFVNVLDTYIAVYFVRNMSLDRFDATITDVIDPEVSYDIGYSDPYYNIWLYLGAKLSEEDYSFGPDKDLIDDFYNSVHNDKELVLKFLKEKYIKDTTDEEVKVSIINRDSLEFKHDTIMGEFALDFEDLEDDLEEEEEVEEQTFDVVEKDTDEDTTEDNKEDADDMKDVLAKAIMDNAGSNEHKDDSMIVEVHHKEGNN